MSIESEVDVEYDSDLFRQLERYENAIDEEIHLIFNSCLYLENIVLEVELSFS